MSTSDLSSFEQSVYRILKQQAPDPITTTKTAKELDADRERTRLVLRKLFRLGYVTETGDWKYRATYPIRDVS